MYTAQLTGDSSVHDLFAQCRKAVLGQHESVVPLYRTHPELTLQYWLQDAWAAKSVLRTEEQLRAADWACAIGIRSSKVLLCVHQYSPTVGWCIHAMRREYDENKVSVASALTSLLRPEVAARLRNTSIQDALNDFALFANAALHQCVIIMELNFLPPQPPRHIQPGQWAEAFVARKWMSVYIVNDAPSVEQLSSALRQYFAAQPYRMHGTSFLLASSLIHLGFDAYVSMLTHQREAWDKRPGYARRVMSLVHCRSPAAYTHAVRAASLSAVPHGRVPAAEYACIVAHAQPDDEPASARTWFTLDDTEPACLVLWRVRPSLPVRANPVVIGAVN